MDVQPTDDKENKDKMDQPKNNSCDQCWHKLLAQHPQNAIPYGYNQMNLPQQKPRQKPPNIPKMAKKLVKMACHPERKVGHVDLGDFQHREVQTLSLYVLLESNKFEKFRTRMHPIYTNKFIIYTLLQASEHAIASRIMCKTTWLVDMLAQIMENAETSAVWGNVVFIFRNIAGSYVKMQKDRWDYLNQGALKVMCESLWRIKYDLSNVEDSRAVRDTFRILSMAMLSKNTEVQSDLIKLLKPNLIKLTDPLPTNGTFSDRHLDALSHTFKFLTLLMIADRTFVRLVKKTKMVRVARQLKPASAGRNDSIGLHIKNFFLWLSKSKDKKDVSLYGTKKAFKHGANGYMHTWCGWNECGVSDKIKKLKHCSGCSCVCYCSVECQKRDWKLHKRLCDMLAQGDVEEK